MDKPYPRSFWFDEALTAERAEPRPPLQTDRRADVCIVGGGYTGLWTALQLKEAEPNLDVVLARTRSLRVGRERQKRRCINDVVEQVPILARTLWRI